MLLPVCLPCAVQVAVCPADARTVVYPSLVDAGSIWVKGSEFTVERLLGPGFADIAGKFVGGSLVIARLAPQDYHRWHMPVTGKLGRRYVSLFCRLQLEFYPHTCSSNDACCFVLCV